MAVTQESISSYLSKKGSPLAPYAKDFVEVGNKYGIDPRFLVAISGIETSFGTAGSKLANPFGYMSAKKFSGPRQVLELMGRDLTRTKNGYYTGKNTIDKIGATWAPPNAANDAGGNAGWPAAVRKFYAEMGGNPNAPVKGSGVVRGSVPSGVQPPAPTVTTGGGLSPKAAAAIRSYASQADQAFAMNQDGPDVAPVLRMIGQSPRAQIGMSPTQSVVPQSPTIGGSVNYGALASGGVDSGKLFKGGLGGNWGGSLDRAVEIQQLAGITPSSQKRSRQMTASGGVSDHWQGSTSSYAMDLPGAPGDGRTDAAASKIVAALGGPKNWGKTGGNFTTTVGGYRYQVIWRSNVGGNHYDHIHVGVRKA
jgi:hypothetical protein